MSLSMMTSSSIHFPANDMVSFFFVALWIYTTFSLSVHLFFPPFGLWDESCKKRRYAGISLVY
jgi:hypothetical protein